VTDAELIVASRRDPAAFRELYDRWADKLLAWFYRRVFDAEVAADLLAETFAVAFERRHRFRDTGQPGAAWLYGIAAKELSHWFRHQAVERRAVRRLGIDVPALDDESIARIEALADAATHRPALTAALARMTDRERDAVQLRVVEELPLPGDRSQARLQRGRRPHPRPPRSCPPRPPAGGDTVSEIPFVNRLGDAIQAAITNPRVAARHRFGPRRRLGLLAVAALLLGGGAAAARILGTPEELATSSIACQLEGSSTGIVWAGDRSPLEVCAQEYRAAGKPVPPLVACVDGRSVVVLPGRGPEACGRRGLAPLPPEYAPARAKVAKLERDILAWRPPATVSRPRSWPPRCSACWTAAAGGGGGPGRGRMSRRDRAARCPASAAAGTAASAAHWTTTAIGSWSSAVRPEPSTTCSTDGRPGSRGHSWTSRASAATRSTSSATTCGAGSRRPAGRSPSRSASARPTGS
jgi:RNA polymerase sigma-70 factor, ECF subfamily